MMQLPSLLLPSFRRQSHPILRWRYTTAATESLLLPVPVLESPRFRNGPLQRFSVVSSSSTQAPQPPAQCIRSSRMMMSTVTEDAANGSSSSNIQSQQRIKRFYKIVNVVEVVTTTTNDLIHPRPPPSQLVSLETETTTSSSDDDHNTASNDMTTSTKKWYTITLDGKQLKTPSGQIVIVPTITLAHLIAIEWNSVTSHIIPNQMPIMTYVCTVLDQVRKHKAQYEQLCFQYVMTDTLGYPANPTYEPILYQQQQKAWYPIKHWIHSSFVPTTTTTNHPSNDAPSNPATTTTPNVPPWTIPWVLSPNVPPPSPPRTGSSHSDAAAHSKTSNALRSSLSHPNHPHHNTLVQKIPYDPALLVAIQQYISHLDVWYLLALYIGCKECKSFWLSCALLTGTTTPHGGTWSPAQIVTAARLEEECNIQDWGLVEGQHDYDRLNAAIQIRSVALYLQALAPWTNNESIVAFPPNDF